MYHRTLITAAAAALFCSTLLGAAPEHAGKADRDGMRSEGKRNSAVDKSSRREMRDSIERATPRMQQKVPRTSPASHPPKTVRQTARPETSSHTTRVPLSKEVRHQPVRKEPRQQTVTKEIRHVRHPVYRRPPNARPLPYYHRPGYVIRSLPRVALTISLGGLLFYYADGVYYRHHQSGFVVSVPPVGLIVPTLPLGYVMLQLHGLTYYYYGNVYYIWDSSHRGYRVVEAPEAYETYQPGDVVHVLPDGAYSVTIDGVQYYRYQGIYFMQSIQNDRIVYVVVTP